jgi:hypothetical protein
MTTEPRLNHPRRLLRAAHDLVFHHVHGGQLLTRENYFWLVYMTGS